MSGAANGGARCGGQQFKGLEMLFSVSIAADRGGNERGVNVSKSDAWMTWYFQCNFMYNPVL